MAAEREEVETHNQEREWMPRKKNSNIEQDWTKLPDLMLSSILNRLGDGLGSIPCGPLVDFFAFSGVCRPWRLLAKAAKREFMASQPPLFLTGTKQVEQHGEAPHLLALTGARADRFSAYRLDRSKLEWVEVQSLGKCSLFVSYNGCAVVCTYPTRWRGKENCIYLTDVYPHGWTEFRLNRKYRCFDPSSYRWHTHPPLWVFPVQCY